MYTMRIANLVLLFTSWFTSRVLYRCCLKTLINSRTLLIHGLTKNMLLDNCTILLNSKSEVSDTFMRALLNNSSVSNWELFWLFSNRYDQCSSVRWDGFYVFCSIKRETCFIGLKILIFFHKCLPKLSKNVSLKF